MTMKYIIQAVLRSDQLWLNGQGFYQSAAIFCLNATVLSGIFDYVKTIYYHTEDFSLYINFQKVFMQQKKAYLLVIPSHRYYRSDLDCAIMQVF